jgi:hypothetical protein
VPTNNGHAGGTSTSDSASNANGNNGNGTANRHDWPRTEFRSPDSSAG